MSSWTFPTSFITQHPTVFSPPLKAFRLFFFFRFFLLLLLPTAITDSHNSEGKENIRKKEKRGWTVVREANPASGMDDGSVVSGGFERSTLV